jgi:hypothetical protein
MRPSSPSSWMVAAFELCCYLDRTEKWIRKAVEI